jgi:glycerol-1-phosphatase
MKDEVKPRRHQSLGDYVIISQGYDAALLDLDGVIYIGSAAVEHAVSSIEEAASLYGIRFGYVTNNASRPPSIVAEHLRSLGLVVTDQDVVSSAQSAARVLSERFPKGSPILVVGGPGLFMAVAERGFNPVESVNDKPVAAVQGYGAEVGWAQLAELCFAIELGIPWIATNLDRTIPTPRGRALGNGSLVAAISHATGRNPEVTGKPEPPLMLESIERMSAIRPIVVGDRLDTDIEGARRSNLDSLLVLTGVTDLNGLLLASEVMRPTYVGLDLRSLLDPYLGAFVAWTKDRTQVISKCGGTELIIGVTEEATYLVDYQFAEIPLSGIRYELCETELIQAIRATCAAVWALGDEFGRNDFEIGELVNFLDQLAD